MAEIQRLDSRLVAPGAIRGTHRVGGWVVEMETTDSAPVHINWVRLSSPGDGSSPPRQIPYSSLAREHLAHVQKTHDPHQPEGGPTDHTPDRLVLATAKEYVSLVRGGDRSAAKTLAARSGVTVAAIHRRLAVAREREYLTSPGKGKAGGELTAAARQILDATDEPSASDG